MPDCKFPEDVMLCILTRLPAKSICRFRCVCKPWLALFATPRFVSLHLSAAAASNPSLVIHSITDDDDHVISFFGVNAAAREAVKVTHPFPEFFYHYQMDLVGSWNGLVSMAFPPLGQMIVLWNPATRQWKAIRLPKDDGGSPILVSVGLGFDSATADFKVVRIVNLRPKGLAPDACLQLMADVYSADRDSWTRVKLGFKFHVTSTRNDAIIGGAPYWRAFAKDLSDPSGFGEVFVRYDVKKGTFSKIRVPVLDVDIHSTTLLVEWRGSLAILAHTPSRKDDMVDVVMLDEKQGKWAKKYSLGPVGVPVAKQIQCSNGEEILVETGEGKLFLFDAKTKKMKEVYIEDAKPLCYQAFNYSESLVHLKDMGPVTKVEGQFDFTLDSDEEEELVTSQLSSVLSFAT
ncbi:unnamed protein product [Cuscuta europaea]|uniref:F-box domain-containing protein n=1 Tax=Cuscuta europaea TaxID=41803 RepID=A0A9P0Z623_CUSEU|nr:unnamed protein product [Cuscuta europaea]